MGDKQLEISNLAQIRNLKSEYIRVINRSEELEPESIRFFVKGKEATDDFYVYTYDMSQDTVIAGMIKWPQPQN